MGIQSLTLFLKTSFAGCLSSKRSYSNFVFCEYFRDFQFLSACNITPSFDNSFLEDFLLY